MIVRNGLAHSVSVLFSTGHPDGAVNWRLFDGSGTLIGGGAIAVPAEAVSLNLTISPAYNTLASGRLIASRDFEWDYTVDGAVINGEQRYDVEARAPLGASLEGVRSKLGVEKDDLPDSDISLIQAYLAFRSIATEEAILAAADGGANDLGMRNAVEALAALALIPTMAVRVAVSEDSGTNKFKRQNIDWDAVALALSTVVNDGVLIALPAYDPMASAGALFILATPATDAITGSSAGS